MQPLITTYLEMRSPEQLRPKKVTSDKWRVTRFANLRTVAGALIVKCTFRVGEQWQWIDKRPWTDEQWKEYAAGRSCEHSPRTMTARSQAITNCGASPSRIRLARMQAGRDRILRFVTGIYWPWFRRRVANQRNRRSLVPHMGDRTQARVGAYVQSRSSAGARELSGARHDRLQGGRK